MSEEREKLPLIFLTPLSDVLDSAKRQILKDQEIELFEVNFKELKPEEFMKRVPGVIVSGNPQEAVSFLKLYDEVIKKSSSKMILITEEEAPPKVMKVVKNLRLADYVYGNVQPKTILYKIKLHLKALPKLDEEDIIKISRVTYHIWENSKLEIKDVGTKMPTEEEVRIRGVTQFLGVDRSTMKVGENIDSQGRGELDKDELQSFYDSNRRLTIELEDLLDKFEAEVSNKVLLVEADRKIDEIKNSCLDKGYNELGLFCDIMKTICYKLGFVKDNSFSTVVVGLLFNCAEFLKSELNQVRKSLGSSIRDNPNKALFNRFHWLNQKFNSIEETKTDDPKNINLTELMEFLRI